MTLPNKEQCECEKVSCKSDCSNIHTHKTFSCHTCKPSPPSKEKSLFERFTNNEIGVLGVEKKDTCIGYMCRDETCCPYSPSNKEKVCHSKLSTRPLLYTDTIRGEQICRDDMWAVTTDELNELNSPSPQPEDWAGEFDKVVEEWMFTPDGTSIVPVVKAFISKLAQEKYEEGIATKSNSGRRQYQDGWNEATIFWEKYAVKERKVVYNQALTDAVGVLPEVKHRTELTLGDLQMSDTDAGFNNALSQARIAITKLRKEI